jgi:hypothetical protein
MSAQAILNYNRDQVQNFYSSFDFPASGNFDLSSKLEYVVQYVDYRRNIDLSTISMKCQEQDQKDGIVLEILYKAFPRDGV